MKKTLGILTAAALAGAALLSSCATTDSAQKNSEEDSMVQMANPFGDYAKIEAAEKAAGFSLLAPEEISSIYPAQVYRAISGKMIEVIYPNISDSSDEIRIRKAKDSGDISGDYNSYDESMTLIINGLQVESRGKAGKTNVAVWHDGAYSYAITSDRGLSLGLLREIVEQVQ